LGRCIFVDRRKIWNLKSEITEIERSLVGGFNVVVFPESTTTDGSSMLPFKSSLIQAAVNTSVDVLPICINYRKINNMETSLDTRDYVFWYGDMTFAPHLIALMKVRSVIVELEITGVVSSGSNRKNITANAYHKIQERYVEVVVPVNL